MHGPMYLKFCVQSYNVPVRGSDVSKQQNSEKVWKSQSSSAGEVELFVTRNLTSALVCQFVQSLPKLTTKM